MNKQLNEWTYEYTNTQVNEKQNLETSPLKGLTIRHHARQTINTRTIVLTTRQASCFSVATAINYSHRESNLVSL
jgi:hypothetical protein